MHLFLAIVALTRFVGTPGKRRRGFAFFLFQWTCYGSSKKDKNNDEEDGRDETIVCFDSTISDDVLTLRLCQKVAKGATLYGFFF